MGITEADVPISNPGDDGDVNGGFDDSSTEIEIGNTGSAKKGFFLFRNTGIPQGVTITSAYLTITSSANLADVIVRLLLAGSDEDDPAVPGSVADVNGRPRTAAQVGWANVEAWISNTEYQSPDMTPVIQELVSRSGFASNNILIFVEDNGSTANASRKGHSYNGDPAKAARLYVSWSNASFPLPSVVISGAEIWRSSDMTLPWQAWTSIVFDTASYDTGGYFDVASPTRLTIPEDGIYFMAASFIETPGQNGRYVDVTFRVDGTTDIGMNRLSLRDDGSDEINANGIHPLSAGQYVECRLYQDRAADETLTSLARQSPVFRIQRIA